MKKINDNLFDTKFTSLDLVKIALLIVSFFSTWNIVDLITPDVPFAFLRELAAVTVVEGAFVAFERATANAKNEKQTKLGTLGFFCSLTVIGLFLLASGFLEFGGPALLDTQVGTWAGITWTVNEVVMVAALIVVAGWIVALASIARFFALADPDKQAELLERQLNGSVQEESNIALERALKLVRPEIAIQRTLTRIETDYGGELTPAQLQTMKGQAELRLRDHYRSVKDPDEHKAPAVPVAVRPIIGIPQVAVSGNGNGNGQHPTP